LPKKWQELQKFITLPFEPLPNPSPKGEGLEEIGFNQCENFIHIENLSSPALPGAGDRRG
jgi:hypothetical protein